MRPMLTMLALALAAPLAAQSITVGTATAARGRAAYGAIVVPPGPDSGISMPVAVLNGAAPGPVVALVAGSHGTEYTSIVALTRLLPRLDPARLRGTVIVTPLLNVASFREMTPHLNPVDGKSMNRIYPGRLDGTQTERALALMAREVVRQADVIVDLHGGDLDEDLRPYSYWFRGGNPAQDSASYRLALAFGLDHIIVADMDLDDPATRGNLGGYALSLGKTVLVAEAGHAGTVTEDDLALLDEGLLNLLGALGLIDRPVTPVAHPVWLDAGARLAAEGDGMFEAAVGRGTYVNQGMTVGWLTDWLGRDRRPVQAPATGVVTFIRAVPSVWKGATLVNVGRVLDTPPPYHRPRR